MYVQKYVMMFIECQTQQSTSISKSDTKPVVITVIVKTVIGAETFDCFFKIAINSEVAVSFKL